MPVFNDRDFIEASLNCILNQTFYDFKLIISDDGSTDGSAEICKTFEKKDNRITYIRQSANLGISRNMQFLLNEAKTKYFMWAGDDDLYSNDFIEKHIQVLETRPDVVSVFSTLAIIDEKGMVVKDEINYDYQHPNTFKRVKNFICNSTDYFGYGLFRREKIAKVEFPVWWWPNKKTPYNNIYPTLCYYLAKGDYCLIKGSALFHKRIKSPNKTHHKLTGKGNGFKESLAFWLRRFNLVVFTFKLINKANGFVFSLKLLPYLWYYWFLIPSYSQLKLAGISFIKNRLFYKKKL